MMIILSNKWILRFVLFVLLFVTAQASTLSEQGNNADITRSYLTRFDFHDLFNMLAADEVDQRFVSRYKNNAKNREDLNHLLRFQAELFDGIKNIPTQESNDIARNAEHTLAWVRALGMQIDLKTPLTRQQWAEFDRHLSFIFTEALQLHWKWRNPEHINDDANPGKIRLVAENAKKLYASIHPENNNTGLPGELINKRLIELDICEIAMFHYMHTKNIEPHAAKNYARFIGPKLDLFPQLDRPWTKLLKRIKKGYHSHWKKSLKKHQHKPKSASASF